MTLGYTDQDAYIALGTVPVAVTDWMGFGGGVGPWATPLLDGARPEVLKDTDGIPFEQIAALRPDVISALYSGITRKDYTTLSKIAPVVVAPAGTKNWGITWQASARAAGQVLGRSEEAAELVADVEGDIAAAVEAHPEFAGKQATMAMYFEGYWVYGPTDPRSKLLEALGFTLPPDLASATGDEYAVEIGRRAPAAARRRRADLAQHRGRSADGRLRPALHGVARARGGPRPGDRQGHVRGDRLRLAAQPAVHARQDRGGSRPRSTATRRRTCRSADDRARLRSGAWPQANGSGRCVRRRRRRGRRRGGGRQGPRARPSWAGCGRRASSTPRARARRFEALGRAPG